MFDKLKHLFVKKTVKETEQKLSEERKSEVVFNSLDVFKTPEGQGRWTLVVGAEGQGKTYFVKQIAKAVRSKGGNFGFTEAPEFEPTQNVDLFVIDDLGKAEPQKQREVFEFLCGARHRNIKNVICVTHELKGIPSEVIRRFKVVIFFYSAKQHMKLQTLVRGGLKQALQFANVIMDLKPREYMLYDVQSGFIKNPPLPNTETQLVLKAMSDVIPKPKHKTPISKNGKITLENGEKLNRENVKITPLIVKTLREHPEYKYAYIAQQFHTSEHYVKKVAYKLRHGMLKYA